MSAYKPRRRFTREFKQETVELILNGNRSIGDVCSDLEIHRNTISRWIKEYKENGRDAFPGNGKLLPADEEIRQLKRELARVKEERDILKKVVPIFYGPQK